MSRTREQPMWHQLFQLDHENTQSLQTQLRLSLVNAILDGRVAIDLPLPSSRELARQLGVARNTVVLAYQHLVDENYLIARERRGYFVNPDILEGRVDAIESAKRIVDDNINVDTVLDLQSQRNLQRPADWNHYQYPFIYGQVDSSLFPVNDWREACRLSLHVGAINEWTHDRIAQDDELLLEQIHKRVLPRRGVWAEPDQILITTGAQNALFITAQLLLDKQSTVGIEDPCYPDARNIFSLFAGKQIEFPVGNDGVQTDERLTQCRLMYVTPSHQCPTTTTMPLAARQELLALASEHGVMIVEDDYESELNFVGKPTPALKSLDESHSVIYIGSLSKTLAPGLRVGFMVGPKSFIKQARALRRLMYRHPPSNTQRTVGHFLSLGHHDAAIMRLSQTYKQRWDLMNRALGQHMSLSTVAPAFGGSSYWVKLPDHVRAAELEQRAAEQSVFVNAGDTYFAEPAECLNFCRLGFSSILNERIEPGIERLAHVIDSF